MGLTVEKSTGVPRAVSMAALNFSPPPAEHEPPHRAGAGVTGDAEARARAEEGVRRVRPRVIAESGQRLESRGACW